MKPDKKVKWIRCWGVSIFSGRQKINEIIFKAEKDMAYFLYKHEKE